MQLIDLGHDFFLARFQLEDYTRTIAGGLWFLNEQYITTWLWQPNFDAKIEKTSTTAIWARLVGLPLGYYAEDILKK